MANFLRDLLEAAEDEPIEGLVLGNGGWGDFRMEDWPEYPKGRVVSLDEVRDALDREYDDGFGSPECPSTYAWTPTRVLFVVQYDGSTRFSWMPRNPVDCMPSMPGG